MTKKKNPFIFSKFSIEYLMLNDCQSRNIFVLSSKITWSDKMNNVSYVIIKIEIQFYALRES